MLFPSKVRVACRVMTSVKHTKCNSVRRWFSYCFSFFHLPPTWRRSFDTDRCRVANVSPPRTHNPADASATIQGGAGEWRFPNVIFFFFASFFLFRSNWRERHGWRQEQKRISRPTLQCFRWADTTQTVLVINIKPVNLSFFPNCVLLVFAFSSQLLVSGEGGQNWVRALTV